MLDDLGSVVQSNMVELSGGRFHYLSWGAEQQALPTAVLLHGITSSALSWVRVGPALADRYRVFALDMRGHGDSPKAPAGEYSLRRTADDAAEFIAALHLEQSLLIGHSWGGATALVLASGAGSEVVAPDFSKIILEDPAHNFSGGNPVERAKDYTKDIGRPAEEVRAELLVNSPGWTKADIDGKLDALNKVSREAVISVFEQGYYVGSLLPLLANLTPPTLLLRADPAGGSTLKGASWEEAQTYMHAPSQAVQIDGASHNIHRSKFEAFMQAVNDFLRL